MTHRFRRAVRPPTLAGALTVLVLFTLLLAGAVGLGYASRDAAPGTVGHALAALTFPEHVRWVQLQDDLDAEFETQHRITVLDTASSGACLTPDPSDVQFLQCYRESALRLEIQFLSEHPGGGWALSVVDDPVVLAPGCGGTGACGYTVLSFDPRTGSSAVRTTLAHRVRSSPPAESWGPALVFGTAEALVVLLTGWVVAGRRPTRLELAAMSSVLPAPRRVGWREFVLEVWDHTETTRERHAQMRNLLISLPATAVLMWVAHLRHERPTSR